MTPLKQHKRSGSEPYWPRERMRCTLLTTGSKNLSIPVQEIVAISLKVTFLYLLLQLEEYDPHTSITGECGFFLTFHIL
ncbi:hypothetical protein E5288_WYG013405 [Bos mutus]|uniref:Uncharacterized protein n=1 Tax=Bos mutus TaxID=72004 RepID=A0A6B0SAX1_9CETA|nr:hypothetical protein [Bos mutus]